MIKTRINNEYKDIIKIFGGGTLQKEIIKVWSGEAQEYVYESSVEYTGSLPITINANGDALLDYRIYGADGGVGEQTENLFDKNAITPGSLVNDTTGEVDHYKYYDTTAIIEIESDFVITFVESVSSAAQSLRIAFYDAQNNFISCSHVVRANSPYNVVVPNETKRVRVSYSNGIYPGSSYPNDLFIGLITPASYIPYGYKLPMTVQSANLFDKNAAINGYEITGSSIYPSSSWCISDFISVVSGGFYRGNNLGNAVLAYQSKTGTPTRLSGIKSGITLSGNINFIIVNCLISNKNIASIVQVKTTPPVYIGENQLDEGEYVSYSEQKVYRRTAQVMPSAPVETKVQNGITITCDGQGRYSISGTATSAVSISFDIPEFTIPISVGRRGQGTLSFFNKLSTYSISCIIKFCYNSNIIDSWSLQSENRTNTTYITLSGKKCNAIVIEIPDQMSQNGIVSPMFTNDGVLPIIYAPYLQPTDPPVSLPEIPTIDGTTIIDYDGEPKPSQMYVKYRR